MTKEEVYSGHGRTVMEAYDAYSNGTISLLEFQTVVIEACNKVDDRLTAFKANA